MPHSRKPARLPSLRWLRACFDVVITKRETYLRWRVRPRWQFTTDHGQAVANGRAGKRAGNIVHCPRTSYYTVGINGVTYLVHRILWKMLTGKDPGAAEIDHEDGNGLNNNQSNLRRASHTENAKNIPVPINNTSGTIGVSYSKEKRKWEAYIKVAQRRKYLGRFDDKADAIKARQQAEKLFGFHANHGRAA